MLQRPAAVQLRTIYCTVYSGQMVHLEVRIIGHQSESAIEISDLGYVKFPVYQGGSIQVEVNGQWQDVPIPAGHIAIFPGYTLERATCGLIKATKHRVVSTF